MIRKIYFFLMVFSLAAAPVLAQEKQGLTSKVYDVKYQDPGAVAQLLTSLDVGLVPGSINSTFNTLTVRANEQGHAAVADLIRKYDVPVKTIEFQFFLIRADAKDEGLKNGLPEKVQKALKEVASLTRYKGFTIIDAPFLRTQEDTIRNVRQSGGIKGKGIYNYSISIANTVIAAEENNRQIRIGGFNITFTRPFGDESLATEVNPSGGPGVKKVNLSVVAELSTPFSIAEGEIVVIGASQVESSSLGPAIITIVTATIL
jgi:hypothetical protein